MPSRSEMAALPSARRRNRVTGPTSDCRRRRHRSARPSLMEKPARLCVGTDATPTALEIANLSLQHTTFCQVICLSWLKCPRPTAPTLITYLATLSSSRLSNLMTVATSASCKRDDQRVTGAYFVIALQLQNNFTVYGTHTESKKGQTS